MHASYAAEYKLVCIFIILVYATHASYAAVYKLVCISLYQSLGVDIKRPNKTPNYKTLNVTKRPMQQMPNYKTPNVT